jgi:hypothetical protein
MERELWPLLYPLIREVGKAFRRKYVSYQPWVLVALHCWGALHDRPATWARDPRHRAGTRLRPARLPSAGVLARRLGSVAVGALLRAIERRVREAAGPTLLALLDGKPRAVGGCTKGPDAKRGRGAGGMASGYKLHALWAGRPVPEVWAVPPLTVHEVTAADDLLGRVDGGGYLLAGGNYDASRLFDRAAARGYQLLVPPPKNAGQGHHYVSPYRRRSIALRGAALGRAVHAVRRRIEQAFGNATAFAGGLGPLPAWVRRLRRVERWVWAKLLINGVRILRKQGLTARLQ